MLAIVDTTFYCTFKPWCTQLPWHVLTRFTEFCWSIHVNINVDAHCRGFVYHGVSVYMYSENLQYNLHSGMVLNLVRLIKLTKKVIRRVYKKFVRMELNLGQLATMVFAFATSASHDQPAHPRSLTTFSTVHNSVICFLQMIHGDLQIERWHKKFNRLKYLTGCKYYYIDKMVSNKLRRKQVNLHSTHVKIKSLLRFVVYLLYWWTAPIRRLLGSGVGCTIFPLQKKKRFWRRPSGHRTGTVR